MKYIISEFLITWKGRKNMSEEKWVFIIDDTDNSASQSSYSSEKERLENIEDLKKIRKSFLESCTKK